MTSPTSILPPPVLLSPLARFMPQAYVRQIYCFPTANSYAVNALSRGLSGLAHDVPYILSRIVRDKPGTGSGVKVSTPCSSVEDIFSWHDLSGSISYAALKAGCFPPGAFLAPGITPPDALPPYPDSPAVFLARASLVDGGLILCVAVHHAVTDITGYGALLKIWAAHCRHGSSQGIGFSASWMDRAPLFLSSVGLPSPSNSTSTSMPDLLHIATPETPAQPVAQFQAGQGAEVKQKKYQTGIFYFPQQQLRALKDAVNKHIASKEPGSWVSTNDMLSSLLWSSIVTTEESSCHPSAKKAVTDEETRISILSFPVQFRSVVRPPLPNDFLGAAFLMTNAKVLHKDVCLISRSRTNSKSTSRDPELKLELHANADEEALTKFVDIPALARVALAIRWSTRKVDDAAVRRVLAYLEAHPDIDPEAPLKLGPPRHHAGSSGTSVVSWADQRVYELDWGDAIGRCDTVRLAKMGYERAPIVLPRVPPLDGDNGGLEVIMSYEEHTMQRLIESLVMRHFAVLRCLS